jgi:hypothetical protein
MVPCVQADHDLYDDIGSHVSELPSRQPSLASNQQAIDNHKGSVQGTPHLFLPSGDTTEKPNVAAGIMGHEVSPKDALLAIADVLQLPQGKRGPAHVLAAAQACFQGVETLNQRLQEEQAKHLSSQVQVCVLCILMQTVFFALWTQGDKIDIFAP